MLNLFGIYIMVFSSIRYARDRGVTIKHFSVMPLLLDDLCNAVNFYGSSTSTEASKSKVKDKVSEKMLTL